MIRSHIRKHIRKHTDRYDVGVSPFDFKPAGAETGGVDLSLPAGKSIVIDWGDGNKTEVSGPVVNQNYTKAYAGAGTFPVTFEGNFGNITRLDINTVNCDSTISRLSELTGLTEFRCSGSNTVSGDIANLPTGLTGFRCSGSNTVSGDIANLPTGLTEFRCFGSNTVLGDIANLPTGLTEFYCYGFNTVSGDIANLPTGLTRFYCSDSNTVSGDIANLPTGLTEFYCSGSNTVSGDIANLPTGLIGFYCYGSNTVSGDIANLPTGLTGFYCSGSNTVSGDIANLPTGLTGFRCFGSNTISDYSGKTWTTRPVTFILIPTGVGGLSTAEIDQLLIDFDDDLVWSDGTITLTGTNAARSAASDAAVNNMVAEGATVTTN